MRLYANLEDVGSEYITMAPTKLSLEPFNDCYYIDLPESGIIEDIVAFEGDRRSIWKPYNGINRIYCYYNYSKKEIDWDGEKDDSVEGDWCQEYKNGVPIGDPYFEEY